MNTLRANIPIVALSFSLAAGCGGEPEPLMTVETTAFGTAGANLKSDDPGLSAHRESIQAGVSALFAKGLCSIDLTVKDLNDRPDLEFIKNRGQAAGRGFAGGELFIAGNIKPQEENIDVTLLSAHEALHACVKTKREMDQDITAPDSDLTGRFFSGFHLAAGLPVADFENTGSLDEASVEWMSRTLFPDSKSKDTGYGQIGTLFGQAAATNNLTVKETADMHHESDIVGVVEGLTGKTGTAERTGCVVLSFVKLQLNYTTLDQATKELRSC